MKRNLHFLMFSALWLLLVSCQEDESHYLDQCQDESCTEELSSISVKVIDEEGMPIALDHYFTLNLTYHHPYQFSNLADDPIRQNSGTYPIVNDDFINEIATDGTSLLFVGFKDEEVVIRERYDVARDCCHIYLIAGNLTVTHEELLSTGQ